MRFRTLVAGLFLALLSAFMALPMTGCAVVAKLLPDVIAAVVDAGQIIDVIEKFVVDYFTRHPDEAAQKKVADVLVKTRSALNIALRTAKGAEHANSQEVDQAFDEFKKLYLELLALVKPYGVSQSGTPGAFKASPGTLEVPEPMAFKPRAH